MRREPRQLCGREGGADSGCRAGRVLVVGKAAGMAAVLDRLQAEGVFAGRDHRQRDGAAIASSVEMLGLKPGAEPGIEDIRLALPEVGRKPASNREMIQL